MKIIVNIKKLILGLFFVIPTLVLAQQDPMFNQYMFNTLNINSGYAGSRDVLSMVLVGRKQWVGFNGAPVSQTFSVHSPIAGSKLAAGISFLNDEIGPVGQTGGYVDLAYHLQVSAATRLAFGIKGGVKMFRENLAEISTGQAGDNAFSGNNRSGLLPNFGFGLYLHNPRFYAGFSIPRVLENTYDQNSFEFTRMSKETRHGYFIAGALFNLGEQVKFKPSMLTKAVWGAPIETDIDLSFLFREKLWLGVFYRTGAGVGSIIQFQFTDQLRAGYSYDMSTTALLNQNSGSHEIMLNYDFVFKKDKIRSPRYF
jgi:type IX secretion system PorP/SprF family membrane protein